MIENDVQYRLTKDWVAFFKVALGAVKQHPPKTDLEKLRINGLQSILGDLLEELAEYEAKLC